MNPNISPIHSYYSFITEPWAVYQPTEFTLHMMQPELSNKVLNATPSEIAEVNSAFGDPPALDIVGSTANIQLVGPIAKSVHPILKFFYGMTDLNDFSGLVRQAMADTNVKTIRIEVNSPGGSVVGVTEAMNLLKEARQTKTVVVETDTLMASAAMFIGSQASTILVSESAIIGSIGAFVTFIDRSKMLKAAGVDVKVIKNKEATFKAAGIMGTALTAEQEKQQTQFVQRIYDMVAVGLIESGRGTPKSAMRGQVFFGIDAVENGLADEVVTEFLTTS